MAPRKVISGGNTTLFQLKNGKYVKRKDVLGAGFFGNILKHVNKNKSKILSVGSKVGKRLVSEAKAQLRKPENQKLLKNVTDQLIEKVTDKIGRETPVRKKKRHQAKDRKQSASKALRRDLTALTKREAKKIGRKRSRELVNDFDRYIR